MSRRHVASLATGVAAAALASCSSGSPSMLDGKSPQARHISGLWWLMAALAVAVYAGVAILVVVSLLRGRSRGGDETHGMAPDEPGDVFPIEQRRDHRLLLYGGLIMPIVVLAVVAVQTVRVSNSLEPGRATVHIEVDAEQYWWRVRYPDEGVTTANEIHVPVGEPVDVTLTSHDVIHSIWVPQLNGKSDVIPGRTNHLAFTATSAGTYRGQCAEFCGIAHAKMALLVFVDTPAAYAHWLADNRAPARAPETAQEIAGARLVATTSCAGCHTVRGTAAVGTLGPDLTHVGARQTLAAATLDNTPAGMVRWLSTTQDVKPGAKMPDLGLSHDEVADIAAYLGSLR